MLSGSKEACIGGSKVRKTWTSKVDAGEAGCVDLYRGSSTALLVGLQIRLMNMVGMLGKSEESFSLSLHFEVDVQWAATIVRSGQLGLIPKADLDNRTALKGLAFADAVLHLHAGIGMFLHKVVVQRRRNWLFEEPVVRPQRWFEV